MNSCNFINVHNSLFLCFLHYLRRNVGWNSKHKSKGFDNKMVQSLKR